MRCARVRKICAALPDVEERPSHGAPTFFYKGKKSFLMFHDDHHGDGRLAIWCAAPTGVQDQVVREEPTRFFVPAYVGYRGWIGVRLDVDVDWDEVAGVVRDAYCMVVPAEGRRRARRRLIAPPSRAHWLGGGPVRATMANPQKRRKAPSAMATMFPAEAPRSAASITLSARISRPAAAAANPRCAVRHLASSPSPAEVPPASRTVRRPRRRCGRRGVIARSGRAGAVALDRGALGGMVLQGRHDHRRRPEVGPEQLRHPPRHHPGDVLVAGVLAYANHAGPALLRDLQARFVGDDVVGVGEPEREHDRGRRDRVDDEGRERG